MKKIQEYIKNNRDLFILKENLTDEIIVNAEYELGFKFDHKYLKYLKLFGLIVFESIEIFGLGVDDNSHLSVIKNTTNLKNKEIKFPNNTVVLEYIEEANYIVYTMNDGVYQYSSNSLSLISTNLEEYLLTHFKEIV